MTASYLAANGLPGITTPYAASGQNAGKEQVWEAIRLAEFPHCGSRSMALYAFQSYSDAERAVEEWFQGEQRVIVEVQPRHIVSCHVADARYLEKSSEEWTDAARHYWRGDSSSDPRIEIILHGEMFFPEWESAPFGMMGL